MYVDIHTGMFKDYGFNWVKFISVKNNMRWICQLESVRCIVMFTEMLMPSAAKLMKTSLKKKKTYIKIPHNL